MFGKRKPTTPPADRYSAYVWANGRLEITRRSMPDGAVLVATGPRDALHELITPRVGHDSGGLRVPGMSAGLQQKECVEALHHWMERLGRFNTNPEINVI